MNIEVILIFVFWYFDMFFTFLNARKYKKLFPEKDYTKLEMNIIVTFFWRKFGLTKGTFVANLFIMPLIIIITFVFPLFYPQILYMLVGGYAVVFTIHYQTFFELKNEENKKT